MTDSFHRRAVESHERARDSFQGSHCSAIGHNLKSIGDRTVECSRCGLVIGDAPLEQTVDVPRYDEGMGGLVAALLYCAGVLCGAAAVLLTLYFLGVLK